MLPPALLAVNQRMTKAFIDANPTDIVVVPCTRVSKPAGGWTWEDGVPLDPQTVTVVEPGSTPYPTVTQDGVERSVDFEIVTEHDAVLSTGDWFIHSGKEWDVVEIWYDNGYEKRALVSARGK